MKKAAFLSVLYILGTLLTVSCGSSGKEGFALLKIAIWNKPAPGSDKTRQWVATMNRGEQFDLLKQSADKQWLQVKLSDGKTGWIQKKFVFLGPRRMIQFSTATPWYTRPDAMSPKKKGPIPADTTGFIIEERDGGWIKVNIKSTWLDGWIRKGSGAATTGPADTAPDTDQTPAQSHAKAFSVNINGIGTCTVTASGWLTDKDGYSYSPEKMFDGKMGTSWQEAAAGSGIGQWIRIKLPAKMTVLVEIVNGFSEINSRYGDLYKKNSRVTGMQINYGDNLTASRTVSLSGSERGFQSLGAFTTDEIKLTVTAAEKGSQWDDTSISELRLKKLD